MNLSPMRFKDYVWPHNPRVYEIEFRRRVAEHKVPFGLYTLQSTGRGSRVLRGEGEFCGPGAYEEFKRLATVFCDDSPGVLSHPVWQTARAWFVELALKQEPTEDYVAYSFEFRECCDGYSSASAAESAGAARAKNRAAAYHTVAAGESMWAVAVKNGLSLRELAALNPGVKNPNGIRAGDSLRIR